MKNKELDFLLRALEAGNFDEDVIKLLQRLIADYKELKRQNSVYQQILIHVGIDAEWESAEGDPVKPLFKKLKQQ